MLQELRFKNTRAPTRSETCLADDKILGIARLLSTQIPLGPSKNFVEALLQMQYTRSGPNFYHKMRRGLTGSPTKEPGLDIVSSVNKKNISEKPSNWGQVSWKTRYGSLS